MRISRDRVIYVFCLTVALLFNSNSVSANTKGYNSLGVWNDAGHGAVHMPGAIIDAACSIATESQNQTVNVHLVNISTIMSYGHGEEVPFYIEMEHCTRKRANGKTDWKDIKISFSGAVDHFNDTLFDIHGSLRGFGIQLRDSKGAVIVPGEVTILNDIPISSKELRYSVRVAADSGNIEGGMGNSTIQLRLDYE